MSTNKSKKKLRAMVRAGKTLTLEQQVVYDKLKANDEKHNTLKKEERKALKCQMKRHDEVSQDQIQLLGKA